MHSENLFNNYSQVENNAPLADKLRPKNLEEFLGILSKYTSIPDKERTPQLLN